MTDGERRKLRSYADQDRKDAEYFRSLGAIATAQSYETRAAKWENQLDLANRI
jgi:hypothetical protein